MAQQTHTRAELIDALVTKAKISRGDATKFLESMLQELLTALESGESVKLSRFGNFVIRDKNARVGRNPKTGEEAPITPRRVVTFRPSELLRDRVEKTPN